MLTKNKSAILNLMPKQRGFAPILIILLIAVVVGGYFVYQKQYTPNISQSTPAASSKPYSATKDWKEYQSKELKLSFSYPTEFTVEEEPIDFPDSKQNVIHIQNQDLSIQIEPFVEGAPRGVSNTKVINIDENPATMYIIDPSENNSGLVMVDVTRSPRGYNFSLSHFSSEFGVFPKHLTEEDRTFFNNFLSTVKFTN